jgi:signal transduction histidine kinase
MIERQSGIAISYEKEGTPFAINSRLAIHVYRIIQEALNNVIKHSGASQAWVRLRYFDAELQLEVEDRGSGFDSVAPHRGIGLVAMRERAVLLGGRIEFLHPPMGGTLLRLNVPVDQERKGCGAHHQDC